MFGGGSKIVLAEAEEENNNKTATTILDIIVLDKNNKKTNTFILYEAVSYMILQRVPPVTHAVGNCVKRLVVIVTSVPFFKTPVSPINSIGTGIALGGVFLYSRVKRIKPKPKTAQDF